VVIYSGGIVLALRRKTGFTEESTTIHTLKKLSDVADRADWTGAKAAADDTTMPLPTINAAETFMVVQCSEWIVMGRGTNKEKKKVRGTEKWTSNYWPRHRNQL
jgi:hypothetical protein